ncbi:MAG TPA: choice-of-anchor K domain-containing protein [Coleofasciculaceae cyanobacterium]
MKLNLVTTALSSVALASLVSLTLSSNAQAQTFAGNSSGTWGDPNPGANTSPQFSGVGTNTFTWGDPNGFGVGANQLIFNGNTFSAGIDTLFQVGDLTYFNGTTTIGTTVASVPLNVQLAFATPSVFSEVFSFDFNLVSTPNTGTPEQNADSVYPISSFGSRSFSFGGTDYTLQLTGFSQDGGATTVSEFRVLEGATTTAAVFGRITAAPSKDVPEPATIGGLGLLGVYLMSRRRGQQDKATSVDS